jgi:hypothetical protein
MKARVYKIEGVLHLTVTGAPKLGREKLRLDPNFTTRIQSNCHGLKSGIWRYAVVIPLDEPDFTIQAVTSHDIKGWMGHEKMKALLKLLSEYKEASPQ